MSDECSRSRLILVPSFSRVQPPLSLLRRRAPIVHMTWFICCLDLVGLAINANGEIAVYGYLTDGTIRAFRWTESGGLQNLGANGGWLSQAIAINDNGDVAGVYLDQFNNPHGFIAPREGTMRDLRTPERQIVGVNSITNDGRIAGQMFSFVPSFQMHAFRTLSDGTLQDLGDGTRASVAWRMNDAGQVTGYEALDVTGNSQSAFRFSDEAAWLISERSAAQEAADWRSTTQASSSDGRRAPTTYGHVRFARGLGPSWRISERSVDFTPRRKASMIRVPWWVGPLGIISKPRSFTQMPTA